MNALWGLLIAAAAIAAYFAPAIVGFGRHVTNSGSVFVVNLLLGFTVIGWIVALAMALRTSTSPPGPKRDGVGQWGRDIIDGIRG